MKEDRAKPRPLETNATVRTAIEDTLRDDSASSSGKSWASSLWDNGYACSVSAAFIFAANALCVKLLGGRIPSTEIVLVRSILSIGFCFGAYRASNATFPFYGHAENYGLLLTRGIFGAATMQTFYLAIFLLPLADAVTLFYCNPTMTSIAAWAILGECLGVRGMGGIAGSLAGLIILTQPPFLFGGMPWDDQRTMGTFYGCLSALSAAGTFISIRRIGDKEPTLVMSTWFHTASLASSILPLAVGFPDKAVVPMPTDCYLLMGVGLSSFVGQMVLSRGFQLLPAAKASAINFTQVVWSYIFGAFFLHDAVTLRGAMGSSLIAAGAILVTMSAAAAATSSTGPAVVDTGPPQLGPLGLLGSGSLSSYDDIGESEPAVLLLAADLRKYATGPSRDVVTDCVAPRLQRRFVHGPVLRKRLLGRTARCTPGVLRHSWSACSRRASAVRR